MCLFLSISSYLLQQIFARLNKCAHSLNHNLQHGIFTHPPPQVSGEMMETAKNISIAGSNNCENAMSILSYNVTENAKKIQHKSQTKLPKNQTAKKLPFSLFFNFETAEKILSFTNQIYETVKAIVTSFDFHLNQTAWNETPKDISSIVLATAQKSVKA